MSALRRVLKFLLGAFTVVGELLGEGRKVISLRAMRAPGRTMMVLGAD